MRLAIESSGYSTAATEFADANRVAALHYDSLTGKLGGYAAMAGDDSTSADFAAAYDDAAATAVASMVDLVAAFANLSRLTEASLTNHRNANLASVITGATVYDGSGSILDAGLVSVLPSTPPSSLGGDPPSFSDEVTWILDHLEGFVWPNADVDRLRDAAVTWRSAAENLEGLTAHCDTAGGALATQESPEIPVAIAATDQLAATVRDLAGQFVSLASACETYADQVESAREQTEALIKQLLAEIVVGVVVGAAITAITGGAAAGVSTGAILARVASYSPRFAAIIYSLRAAALTTSSTLRTTGATIRTLGGRIRKFTGNRLLARTEAGHLTFGFARRKPGWLSKHERSGSHTLSRHVGKTDEQLRQRLLDDHSIRGSSSFSDQSTAERAIGELMDKHGSRLSAWLKGSGEDLALAGKTDWVVGRHVDRAGLVTDAEGLRIFMVRDDRMTEGFRIVTAYPKP